MARQGKPSDKTVEELKKLGVSWSLVRELSDEEARELLRALKYVLKKFEEIRKKESAASGV
jgi:hypothetical protein